MRAAAQLSQSEAFMQNKRKHERIKKKVKSQVEASDLITYSSTQDLSSGGMFITTPDPASKDSELNISIKLPDGEFLNVKGLVKWTKDEDKEGNPAGMGIEFIHLTDEDTKKLKKHL